MISLQLRRMSRGIIEKRDLWHVRNTLEPTNYELPRLGILKRSNENLLFQLLQIKVRLLSPLWGPPWSAGTPSAESCLASHPEDLLAKLSHFWVISWSVWPCTCEKRWKTKMIVLVSWLNYISAASVIGMSSAYTCHTGKAWNHRSVADDTNFSIAKSCQKENKEPVRKWRIRCDLHLRWTLSFAVCLLHGHFTKWLEHVRTSCVQLGFTPFWVQS